MLEKIEVTIDPAEVTECMLLLGLTYRGLADLCGLPEKRVRQGKLPQGVVDALRARAAHARAHPFPVVFQERFVQARVRRREDGRLAENRAA